ncbi:rare lipoprotein A precursor [mine drainage metagenome]|uniref:Rare lipoprotein A n=1 Tax=mine drainage metagenome TaxID=410659 RepID=A0A1J5SF36_9ZZZZ
MRNRRSLQRFKSRGRVLVVLAGCAFLGACASQPEAYQVGNTAPLGPHGGVYKVGKPYQIDGVWYYPSENYDYDETGIASWYGPHFDKQYTANGERFDQNEVTAAHRTLPMPSFVRVTNLDNGRSLVVRINDRGPFAHGRILDLSRRAAQLLGMEGTGTARVRVQIMADESRQIAMQMNSGQLQADTPPVEAAPRAPVMAESLPPPGVDARPQPIIRAAPAPRPAAVAQDPALSPARLARQTVEQGAPAPGHLFIQAGAFQRYTNANRLNAALQAFGQSAITQVQTREGPLFRVRLGPFSDMHDADALLETVLKSGYPDAKLVVD